MTLTKRRKQDDVFLIGEESLLSGQVPGPDPDPATAEIGPAAIELDSPAPACAPPHPAGALAGTRGIALLGLGAAAAVTLGALELAGGGDPAPVHHATSPRSPLIARSAASAPARAEVPSSPPVTHERPVPERPPTPRHTTPTHRSEPEREPAPTEEAPVSSPVESTPVPSPAPAGEPAAAPASPSPPPPSSGGGSGGVERFGFER